MEKHTLAPTIREITVNRAADAADDLFAYEPETAAQARSLGHLFVVGNTAQESGPSGYLVSLIAAMAKREYYATQPAGDAKQSFARMLRKVNEVVEEFFKANEVEINVGIFAVAGSTLYVSRLGKFRVLLARQKKVIDVLKDISLFSKEVIQKHRFSSIISGPVQNEDRMLAYFPQLAITRREKVIKTHLPTESVDELSARLAEFGVKSPSFSCSLLHIDIGQVPVKDDVPVHPSPTETAAPHARLAWKPRQGPPAKAATADTTDGDWPEETDGPPADGEETPNIIPSEFTHRSRTGSISRALRGIRVPRSGSHGKLLVLAVAVIAVVGGTFMFKSYLFTDETQQKLNAALESAAAELAGVRELMGTDTTTARSQVIAQLDALDEMAQSTPDEKLDELRSSFMDALDEIDRAETATVTLVATIPADEGTPQRAAVASGSDSIWVVAGSPTDAGFTLLQVVDGLVADSEPLSFDADLLISAPPTLLLGDTSERILHLYGSELEPHTLPTPDRILDGHWFLDYAYLLTSSGIVKVEDLDTVKPVTKQWLNDVSELANGARLIAVDGDVWTLSTDGTLTKYFRGDRVDAVRLPLAVTDGNKLLTTEDMSFLYVTDIALKRVHVIDKESMQLIHTVTVDTEQEVKGFFMDPGDYSLFMLASDGKIWRVE